MREFENGWWVLRILSWPGLFNPDLLLYPFLFTNPSSTVRFTTWDDLRSTLHGSMFLGKAQTLFFFLIFLISFLYFFGSFSNLIKRDRVDDNLLFSFNLTFTYHANLILSNCTKLPITSFFVNWRIDQLLWLSFSLSF